MKSFDRQRLQEYIEAMVEDEMRKAIDKVSTNFNMIALNQITIENGGSLSSYEAEINPAIASTTIKEEKSKVSISVIFDCEWRLSASVEGMTMTMEIPQEPEGKEITIVNESGVLEISSLFTNEQG